MPSGGVALPVRDIDGTGGARLQSKVTLNRVDGLVRNKDDNCYWPYSRSPLLCNGRKLRSR